MKDYYQKNKNNAKEIKLFFYNLENNTLTCLENISSQFRKIKPEIKLTFDKFLENMQDSRIRHDLHACGTSSKFKKAFFTNALFLLKLKRKHDIFCEVQCCKLIAK